jgi:hypothetical protein
MNPNVPHMHMNGALGQSSANKEKIQHAPTSTHWQQMLIELFQLMEREVNK